MSLPLRSLTSSAVLALSLCACTDLFGITQGRSDAGDALPPGAKLVLNVAAYDFGRVEVGATTQEARFVLRNDSTEALTAPSPTLSGEPTFIVRASTCAGRLEPGASCEVSCVFAPLRGGRVEATLRLGEGEGAASAVLSGVGTAEVAVSRDGDGSGTVRSEPEGIDCGSRCAFTFAEPTVRLVPMDDGHAFFTGWNTADCPKHEPCALPVDGRREVTATFRLPWTHIHDGNKSYDFAYDVASDEAGNIYVVGEQQEAATPSYRPWLRKLSPTGEVLFTQTDFVPNTTFGSWSGITPTNDGGFIVVGRHAFGTEPGGIDSKLIDAYVQKIRADGFAVWGYRHSREGVTARDWASAVATDAAGNVFVSGYERTADGNDEAILMKLSPAGTLVWLRRFPPSPSGYNQAYRVAVDKSGNPYLVGSASFNGKTSAFVRKYDTEGKELWTQLRDAEKEAGAYGIAVHGNGDVVVTGFEMAGDGILRGWAARWTPTGALVWGRTVDDLSFGHGAAVDADDGVLLGGSSGSEAIVWKLSAAGEPVWFRGRRDPKTDGASVNSVRVDRNGNLLLAGNRTGAGTSSDVWLRKYWR